MLAPIIIRASEGLQRERRGATSPRGPALLVWLILILRLRGIPPLGGFIFKIDFFYVLVRGRAGMGLARFMAGRMIFMYLYITLLVRLLLKTSKGRQWVSFSPLRGVGGVYLAIRASALI